MNTPHQSTRTRQSGRLTLTGELLESLGQAIVSGTFADDRFPNEAEISQRYEISRSVTREAVKMLTAKGMVSARPRAGLAIRPPEHWSLLDPDVLRWMLERKFSYDLLRHFTEMRLGLEPAAAALAAQHATPQALRGIEQGLEHMAAAERGDGDSLAADIAFHVSILEATGNPFYMQLDQLISTALKISIRMTNRIKGHTASVPAHRRVYEAIRARDPQRARTAMTSILSEVGELISSQSDAEQTRRKPRRK